MELHQSYTRWWFILLTTAFIADLMGWTTIAAVSLIAAAIVEVVAVFVRKKKGDSLSEHVWKIVKNRPAVLPPVVGFSVWLVWTCLKLFPATQEFTASVQYPVGILSFAVGVLIWMIFHFVCEGEYR